MDVWVVSQQYIKVMCILNEKKNSFTQTYSAFQLKSKWILENIKMLPTTPML